MDEIVLIKDYSKHIQRFRLPICENGGKMVQKKTQQFQLEFSRLDKFQNLQKTDTVHLMHGELILFSLFFFSFQIL